MINLLILQQLENRNLNYSTTIFFSLIYLLYIYHLCIYLYNPSRTSSYGRNAFFTKVRLPTIFTCAWLRDRCVTLRVISILL